MSCPNSVLSDMATHALSDFRVLIVPGLHGSGPQHWQTRWQRIYPSFERVEQVQWDIPDIEVWSERLDQMLRHSSQPTLIVAHSFGCLATVHRISRGVDNLIGALLVAPADPDKFGVADHVLDIALPCPSILIGSANDPWMDSRRAAYWADLWQCEFLNAGTLGHINAESGLGDWAYGLSQLQRLVLSVEITHLSAK